MVTSIFLGNCCRTDILLDATFVEMKQVVRDTEVEVGATKLFPVQERGIFVAPALRREMVHDSHDVILELWGSENLAEATNIFGEVSAYGGKNAVIAR